MDQLLALLRITTLEEQTGCSAGHLKEAETLLLEARCAPHKLRHALLPHFYFVFAD